MVSALSDGVVGIRTENRPAAEVNRTQPLLSATLVSRTEGIVVAGGGVVVLRGLPCSWALRETLNARAKADMAKNLFILNIPSNSRTKTFKAYTDCAIQQSMNFLQALVFRY